VSEQFSYFSQLINPQYLNIVIIKGAFASAFASVFIADKKADYFCIFL